MDEVKLGDALTLQRGYDLPLSKMINEGVPVVGSNGVVGYHNQTKCIVPCITVGRSGSVGKVHIYEKPVWVHNTALYITDFHGNNPYYLYYLLQLIDFSKICGSSVIPSLDRKNVYPLSVPFHKNINEQNKIVSILSALDAKISLNKRMNEELEKMARELYDYWFVQFNFPDENGNPYKSSGGKMQYNPILKRPIPLNWEVKKVGDCCYSNIESISGFEDGTVIRYLDTGSLSKNVIAGYQRLVVGIEKMPSRAKRRVHSGDILYSTVRPNLCHYGIIYNAPTDLVVSTGYTVLSPKESYISGYLYQTLTLDSVVQRLQTIAQSAVTSYPSINDSDILNLDILLPNKQLLDEYEMIVRRYYRMIECNGQQVSHLTILRDQLLPLLMNGQVVVK